MDAARADYAQIRESCRNEIVCVLHEHWQKRRPQLRKEKFSDEHILNELSAADVRSALDKRGFAFPYAMVRVELTAAKQEYLRPLDEKREELMRAYLAGPPPELPPELEILDAMEALINKRAVWAGSGSAAHRAAAKGEARDRPGAAGADAARGELRQE